MAIDLNNFNVSLETHNFAQDLNKERLNNIACKLLKYIEADEESRSEWLEDQEMWQKLAYQVIEKKNFPWPDASNVKLPILSTSAVQFHARAYPTLVNEKMLVKAKILGKDDPQGTKTKIASQVERYMKYQFLHKMEMWQEDMDRLLLILPIVGLAYKKMYYDHGKEMVVSDLVLAKDLIVNYYATDFERARKTHRIMMDKNEVIELQRMTYFLECDLTPPTKEGKDKELEDAVEKLSSPDLDDDVPHELFECHCWLDIDNDGYQEPWIVTLDKDSKKILRIQPRFTVEGVRRSGVDESIVKITPKEYFIPYKFLPDPNSVVYALGFGHLLGPTNKAANSIINQLVDSGTLSNLPAGFLGKGIRARTGKFRFKPGEWKSIQSTGDDLSRNIVPLPTKDPSPVLFQLLGMLVEYGEKLASVKDIMTGENPGQNQPYSTSMAVLEQGMKVFVGIYKRIYRALSKEIEALFDMNKLYLNDKEYGAVVATGDRTVVFKSYFDKTLLQVLPGADPNIMSDAQKMMRAQALEMKLAQGWPLNPALVQRMVLEAEGHENITELLDAPPPGPPPEIQIKQRELDIREAAELGRLELDVAKAQYEPLKDFAQAIQKIAQAEAEEDMVAIEQYKAVADTILKEIGQNLEARKLEKEVKQNANNSNTTSSNSTAKTGASSTK